MKPARALLPLLGLVAYLLAGCESTPPSRVQLNDRMANHSKKLLAKAQSLRKSLSPLEKDTPVPALSVKPQLDAIKTQIAEIKAALAKLQLPARPSRSAPELYSSYQVFLTAQEKVYEDHLVRIIPVLEGSAGNKEKWKQLEGIFKEAKATEAESLAKLREAQEVFAKEHKFQKVLKR